MVENYNYETGQKNRIHIELMRYLLCNFFTKKRLGIEAQKK